MDTKPNTSKDKDEHLGITFNEVHSDEPQDEITAKQTEITPRYTSNDSHLTNHDDVFNVSKAFDAEHVETGTIVSDKRRQRSSFGNNLRAAFHEWWGKTNKKITNTLDTLSPEQNGEKPVVEKAETRVDIIKEAVAPAQLAPKDDHAIVVEKIRTFKKDVARITGSSIVINEEQHNPNTWKHTVPNTPKKSDKKIPPTFGTTTQDFRGSTIAPIINKKIKMEAVATPQPVIKKEIPIPQEPVANEEKTSTSKLSVPDTVEKKTVQLPKNPVTIAPTITNNVPDLQKKKRESPQIHQSIFAPQEPVKHTFDAQSEEGSDPLEAQEQSQDHAVSRRFHSTPPPPPLVKQEVEVVPQPQTPPETPSPSPRDTKQKREPRLYAPASTDTSSRVYIRWAILIGIGVLGVVLAIIASVYFNTPKKEPTQGRETTPNPSYVETENGPQLLIGGTRDSFLEELRTQIIQAPSGLTQIYPMIPDGTTMRPATSEESLSFLEVHLGGKAMRALANTIVLGSITTTQNEPFIILQSYNFDVLFAGFLAWEPYLYSDFAPVLNELSATNNQYVDAIRNNNSTRILYNNEGKEILLYSFIKQDMVIITTSSEALSKLIGEF